MNLRINRAGIIISAIFIFCTYIFKANAQSPEGFDPGACVSDAFRESTGVAIIDLATGETLTDINGSRLFIPASVTKALTTASVMCLKDSAERFVTPAVALGEIRDGVLEGDLVINCSGDPTIESRHMREGAGIADSIARGLRDAGISRIRGRIIVDEVSLPESGVPSGWMDEDLIEYYGAQLFAANYADNCVTLSLPSCSTSPHTPDLEINVCDGKGKVSVCRERNKRCVIVRGIVPRKDVSRRIANPLPCSTLSEAVRTKLELEGITVDNEDLQPSYKATLIYTHLSPRFIDIMRSLMFRSDNLYAEGMLRTLAPGESREEALAEERDIWADNDLEMTGGLMVEDGSGLSRRNRLSPVFLARVLEWMSHSLLADSYFRIFPKAGKEGTVKNFLKGTALEGRMILKSGSMRGVQSYAGYYLDESGQPSHAVVLMSNNYSGSRQNLKQEMANLLVAHFCPAAVTDDPEYLPEDIPQ